MLLKSLHSAFADVIDSITLIPALCGESAIFKETSTLTHCLQCVESSTGGLAAIRARIVTWLILPVVICLSQRLSHACLSISNLYSETANGSLNQLSFI